MTTLKQCLSGFRRARRLPAAMAFMTLALNLLLPAAALAGNWTPTGSLTTARKNHTATLLPNGKVLVVGGYNGSYLASAELYDPATGTWISVHSLTTARENHTATLLPNGQLLVVGGSNGSYLASTELYDPATNTWTTSDSLPIARSAHTATLLPSPSPGRVLVVGGYNGSYLANAFLYDLSLGLWNGSVVPGTARSAHTATLLPSNEEALVVGGRSTGNSSPVPAAELYQDSYATFSPAGYLSYPPLSSHTATLLPNGQVLVAGGYPDVPLAWLFDRGEKSWTLTGYLATARQAHTAILLPNGKVLVAGGDNANSGTLANAEIYDPATGTWTSARSLTTARENHTATLLPNGKVLVAGGYDTSSGKYLASAEIYDPVSALTGALELLLPD